MLRFQPAGDPVALAVDLLNTADVLVTPPELLADPDALQRFLRRHAFEGDPDDADVHAVRTVRGNLRKAFTAADETAAADALNELLRNAGATPQLERADNGWQLNYRPARPSIASSLAAAAAVPLLEAIRDGEWHRLGGCEAAPCSRVFVDRSRSRSRRFCSGTCADRFAQAAHRRRRSLESSQRAA